MSDNLSLPKDHSDRGNWWHVDSQGRRIGFMWPEDLKAILESIWGHKRGIKNFSVYAGLNISTVEGYCNGKMPVTKVVALLALNMQELMLERKAHTRAYPWREIAQIEAPWLPERKQGDVFKVDPKPFG